MNRVRLLRVPGLVSLLLALVLVLTSVTQAAPPRSDRAPSPIASPGDPGLSTIQLPESALRLPAFAQSAKPAPSKHPNLSSAIAEISVSAKASSASGLDAAKRRNLRVSGDRVQVYVVVKPGALQSASAAIKSAGGDVTKTVEGDTVLQSWLPVGAIDGLIANPDIVFVREPDVAVPQEGTLTSEGVAAANASVWQASAYRGAGVKVAIIDGGFQGYASLTGTDLPGSVVVKNFVDGETDSQVDGTTEHGTACAEIVYDMAPQASLYLVKISTTADLSEAVTWVTAQGVKVISTSLGWLTVTPGDGTGLFANLVNQARSNGILWVTAAGNYREEHWGGAYSDSDGNNFHNFAGTQEVDYFGPGDGNAYNIPAGYVIQGYLRWDDWTAVNQDYDLLLYKWNGASWDLVSGSADYQNGGVGQRPVEAFAYVTSGTTAPYGLAIVRSSATRAVNFELFAPDLTRLDKVVNARSIANLADSANALTVGAVNVTSPYAQESYSSEGPTNGPGGTASGGAIKPDIAGFANVSTVSYGTTEKFAGTSAATPHVAGAAALVFGAYTSYTPDQVRSFLQGRAMDQGATGRDNQFGYGRLNLGAPPASPLPTISGFSPTSGPVGTSVVITGTNLTGATSVKFNGTAATTFTVDSATQITATVPTGATTGPISVTTPGGTGTSASSFTVVTDGSQPQMVLLPKPVRVVDTRPGLPYLGAGQPLRGTTDPHCYQIAGYPTAGQVVVPSNATGVVINLTAVNFTTDGWIAAYPYDPNYLPSKQPEPKTSSINYDTQENAIANFSIVSLGQGQVCLTSSSYTNAIIDVSGYLTK